MEFYDTSKEVCFFVPCIFEQSAANEKRPLRFAEIFLMVILFECLDKHLRDFGYSLELRVSCQQIRVVADTIVLNRLQSNE